jgi:unsaturated chondroitin disaccharide hydrolase
MGIMNKNSHLNDKFDHAFTFSQAQVKRLISQHPEFFPMYTQNGKWFHKGESWTHWCDGFLPGMMWIFFDQTEDDFWFEKAKHYSKLIEHRKKDRRVHDLGFLFWSTYKRWYDITYEPELNDVVIMAGKTLGMRFQQNGGYLCSFLGEESLFIDIMMNIGIVFYAALNTDDFELLNKAHRHCQTTQKYLVRGDGSTSHEGIFDTTTGEFLRQSTQQGWRSDSTWARGLAWALYGFSTSYLLSGERSYLETAKMCANFYLEHTPFNSETPGGPGIPPNDYDDPGEPKRFDSSAAAIAANGFFQLAGVIQDPMYSYRYQQAAYTILDSLCSPEYLAFKDENWEGILKHGIYHLNKGLGVDESVMWGDFFFVEALSRAIDLQAWVDENE